MNNNLKILYNNQDVFNNIAPTPFVSISQDFIDFGTKWNQVTKLSLEGQITGKYLGLLSYSEINKNVNSLLNKFSQNYKSLTITENSQTLYSAPIAVVNSIDFEQGNWYGILPFTIDFIIYDQNLFTNYYGIVEPEEKFSFSEEENKIVNLKHSISAKGIITDSQDAIVNAKNWVISKTGDFSKISPILLQNNNRFILESTNETIDRFNGVYSIENNYTKSVHPDNPSNCFLNYTIDISSGINDPFAQITINGSFEKNNISILRDEYNKLNLFTIANSSFVGIFNTQISSRPIAQSLDENPNENKLNFSVTYNNDFSNEIINDYNIDIRTDSLSCITTVNFNSQISCKYGDIKTKWAKVQSYYASQFFPKNIVNAEYSKESTKRLNQNPITESIKFDEFNAVITYSAEFNDKEIINQDLLSFSSSVNLTPSVNIYVPHTSAMKAREHNVQDLQTANRSKITINVQAVAKIDKEISLAESFANSQITLIKNNYIGGKETLLEDKKITKNNDIKSVEIMETYSYEGDIIT